MIELNKESKTLVERPHATQAGLSSSDDGIKIGMNFENRIVVIEIDQDSQGNTAILTLPIHVAHSMASKVNEACVIINFANAIGLNIEEET